MEEKSIFFSRDLSWIDFNERVLYEALRKDLPLLERLKYLIIVSSNFDEFFMIRIATLKRALRSGSGPDISGLSVEEQLHRAREKIQSIIERQYACLQEEILPALALSGLELLRSDDYSEEQAQYLEHLFRNQVYPSLTPLRIKAGEEVPTIGNLKLHGAFLLIPQDTVISSSKQESSENFAVMPRESPEPLPVIVQIPSSIDRLIWLPSSKEGVRQCTLLDDVLLRWGYLLFPGYSIRESMMFRITRDADISVDEERDEDFIEAMTEVLRNRERSAPVRMVCSPTSSVLRTILKDLLALEEEDIYVISDPIDITALMPLIHTKGFEALHYEPWNHYWPPALPEEGPLWDRIRQSDVLLYHPYHSFEPVVRLLQDAAVDPRVVAIKITLYRTSGDSPIVRALEQAARNGKHVTVVVELKARFDEAQNITWANRLEEAGAIVVYGLARLKVHAKVCLIVRREEDSMVRYVHLSTGNYNDKTARLYADVGLLTAYEEYAQDVTLFFNMITGYSIVQSMKLFSVAPINLKQRILELIDREAKRASQGYASRIVAKLNSLSDPDVIEALYRASQVGVQIQLNIRGICMLVPGVPGLSTTIEVVSVIDRYLEHARMLYFMNGGAEEVYLSSADWMPRNLERRIELLFPIVDVDIKEHIKTFLFAFFKDQTHAHRLQSDGKWLPVSKEKENAEVIRVQQWIYERIKKDAVSAENQALQELVVRRKTPGQ
ncbi:MAG: polyphosphate kinase 1 [Treponemataceae bacterium]|nr:polyphosphate kinase 1 [Treponemataceae bacterium]